MPNKISHFDTPSNGVERACQIAKQLFQHARGQHDTDTECIRTIARQSRLTPATFRRFLQPSRRPKDVSLGIWDRLVAAYRRHLQRELAALEDEISRLRRLDPADAAAEELLHKAQAICDQIRSALPPPPAEPGDGTAQR